MTHPLPTKLQSVQLKVRSAAAGLPDDLQSLGVSSLKFIIGTSEQVHDAQITLMRYDGLGREPRTVAVALRDLVALARLAIDDPRRARPDLVNAKHGRYAGSSQDKMQTMGPALRALYRLMLDGRARTLDEIRNALEAAGHFPSNAGVSARLRDLRKPHFGGHTITREKSSQYAGTFYYRLDRRGSA